MAQTATYAQVTQLAGQLSADERETLAHYLQLVGQERELVPEEKQIVLKHFQKIREERELTFEEWKTLSALTMIPNALREDFSDRREDWYGDDGR